MRQKLRRAYSLTDLKALWGASESETRHWLTTGRLQAHVWFPVMSLYKKTPRLDGAKIKLCKELCHWEGYAHISKYVCHRLLRQGYVVMREFSCEKSGDHYFLPETAEDISIKLDDLVVFEEHRLCFEEKFGLREGLKVGVYKSWVSGDEANDRAYLTDTTFKLIRHKDKEHRLGDMQAAVLCLLYDHARDGNPWQSGKVLLEQVGSQSFTLSNIFKRNQIWRDLILSDGRGSYRLNTKRMLITDE